MEIMFTVFSAFEFVENPFREWTEALGTSRKIKKYIYGFFTTKKVIKLNKE